MNKTELIEDNMKLVYAMVHQYFPTFAKDEDIIQVGMLGLCQAAESWDESKSQFSTFACRCIRNSICNELRSRKKHNGVLSLDYEVQGSEGETATLSDYVIGEDDIEYVDLDGMYSALTPIERRVAELKRIGWTGAEIAKELHISRQAVAKHLRHIRGKWERD